MYTKYTLFSKLCFQKHFKNVVLHAPVPHIFRKVAILAAEEPPGVEIWVTEEPCALFWARKNPCARARPIFSIFDT